MHEYKIPQNFTLSLHWRDAARDLLLQVSSKGVLPTFTKQLRKNYTIIVLFC